MIVFNKSQSMPRVRRGKVVIAREENEVEVVPKRKIEESIYLHLYLTYTHKKERGGGEIDKF